MSDEDDARLRRAAAGGDDHGGAGQGRGGAGDDPVGGDEPREGAGDDPGTGAGWSSTRPPRPPADTPVPPPAPVLPPSDAGQHGRHYDPENLPDAWTSPLPRRSAESPSGTRERSPLTPLAPATPASGATAAPAAGRPRRRSRRLLAWGAVLALALIAGVYLSLPPGGAPLVPTPTPDPVEAALVAPEDLTGLRGGGWTVSQTLMRADDTGPQPRCFGTLGASVPVPATRAVRTLASAGTPTAAVLHWIETYPDAAAAAAAFTARSAQLGTCAGGLYLAHGHEVTGLADAAVGVDARIEQATPEHHTIMLARTGRFLDVVDATQEKSPVGVRAVAEVLEDSLAGQCAAAAGTCPSGTLKVATSALPPAGDPPGWLTSGDLPRVTSGAGAWHGTDLDKMRLPGTQCEAIDLAKVPGARKLAQRTYLLTDDPKAPQGFGIDQATYVFGSNRAALDFSIQVAANLRDCAKRTATAAVRQTGASPSPSSGATFVVEQKVSATTTTRFRVAVVSRAHRATYLLVNPSGKFDYTDASFNAAANRAAERLTQLR